MTTFDSTKASLSELLREIREGKIQLPDFQRGWGKSVIQGPEDGDFEDANE